MITQDPNSLPARLEVTLPVSQRLLADVINAFVAGNPFWCVVVSYTVTEGPEHARAEIFCHEEDGDIDFDEPTKHVQINTEMIKIGIEKIIKGCTPEMFFPVVKASSYTDLQQSIYWIIDSVINDDAMMVDAEIADKIVQTGVYGKIVW